MFNWLKQESKVNINFGAIEQAKQKLLNHPLLITNVLQTQSDLRIFMQHHVFAVWDFMCLVKYLQNHIAPSGDTWIPLSSQNTQNARFINEIVLGEECDIGIDETPISHFHLYIEAMNQVGANILPVLQFVKQVETMGIRWCMQRETQHIPFGVIPFMQHTFDIINSKKPHCVAAAFAYGREKLIPQMFEQIISQLTTNNIQCDYLKFYINRHIELDQDQHGPMADQLVSSLCGDDPLKIIEAQNTAIASIEKRIELWNEVEEAIANSVSL